MRSSSLDADSHALVPTNASSSAKPSEMASSEARAYSRPRDLAMLRLNDFAMFNMRVASFGRGRECLSTRRFRERKYPGFPGVFGLRAPDREKRPALCVSARVGL